MDFLRARGIVQELDEDESPEAVIWTTTTDESSTRRLGEELREWVASNVEVRRILGLEQMLDGKTPEVAAGLFGFPLSPTDMTSWTESVALVVVRRGAWDSRLAASLYELIDHTGVGGADSYVQYCTTNG